MARKDVSPFRSVLGVLEACWVEFERRLQEASLGNEAVHQLAKPECKEVWEGIGELLLRNYPILAQQYTVNYNRFESIGNVMSRLEKTRRMVFNDDLHPYLPHWATPTIYTTGVEEWTRARLFPVPLGCKISTEEAVEELASRRLMPAFVRDIIAFCMDHQEWIFDNRESTLVALNSVYRHSRGIRTGGPATDNGSIAVSFFEGIREEFLLSGCQLPQHDDMRRGLVELRWEHTWGSECVFLGRPMTPRDSHKQDG